ncbi:DEAD/DEAH box helicase family protein [Phocaeicola sp. KGMB11183]|uniref:DEAD/DEAH box helicase family protein n=1 Tax=Phocaeicola acetigenes TaxID=3016083 RepID=A0ABT4PDX9_9BACT|nr:DEAD/DEAH box helicase family protein [Phocaeicola sp. KGMB11183]MCZ8371252.1 DEAD/DEAH box helicase family protein [Phocaeicola sp. KGMB11183]
MKASDNISPILNNPYEEPKWHYDVTFDGNLDYSRILAGRRPYAANLTVVPNTTPNKALFSAEDISLDDENANFINGIRQVVKEWREQGYPKVTRTTRDLLEFWFSNPERELSKSLFFCQREAVETAIYLNEVAPRDPNLGRSILHELDMRRQTVSDLYEDVLPRTAFKMATGTGKTVVMAMLILYHYVNKKENPQDTRFADHFLIVAPGITIRDRLGVLYIDASGKSAYDKLDYYHQRELIPEKYVRLFGGLNSVITITNYHQFEPKVYTGKKSSPFDGKLKYEDGEMVKQKDKEEFTSVLSRLLGKNMKGKRIVVINDEAHHCYLPKDSGSKRRSEEEQETDEENKNAMVWYEGLRQMKKLGYKVQEVYDLSATPYYLKGSGYTPYSLFPWVVSDFGLVDAIESGLVKIPFLPTMDSSHDLDEPKLRNIYQHISKELPKKGQKKAKKEAKENGEERPLGEKAPNLPSLLNLALEQFVKDYEDYDKGIRQSNEAVKNLFTAPPVFIVVCNNTTVSKEVFKYMAGYETVDTEGKTVYIDGHFDIFSNYQNGIPKRRQPSLLIDSIAIDEAGAIVDDDFKKVFANEIQQFKREYATLHGSGSADTLSDGDILREVVNSVGKQGKLGQDIRLVVSVSMLTEGWDANTVTHICGVRAFGSQLLCEQVAGRALRRQNYNLVAYDKEGNEIDPKNIKKYKKENIVYKFPPEYAHIIGVPFKTFKGGGAGTPPPQKPKTVIRALDERKDLEIRFPNIVGYRSENEMGHIDADYTGEPKFKLNFTEIPEETILSTPIGDDMKVLKKDYHDLRDAQVVYVLTQRLIQQYYTDHEKGREFQLFGQLKRIVEKWYNTQIEVIGGDGSVEMRRLVIFWNQKETATSIYEGIRRANTDSEQIKAVLNYYNPEGSTRYVYGATSKEVYPTVKSHVNYVVADTDSWEQIAAKTLEELPQVVRYVKNHFLDFKIPYLIGAIEHLYVPDFIAVVKTKSGAEVNLIIEISGLSNDRLGHKDFKRKYAKDFWLPAANNLGTHGVWYYIEVTDIDNIKAILTHKINSL